MASDAKAHDVSTFFTWLTQEWSTLFTLRRTVLWEHIRKKLFETTGNTFVVALSVGQINVTKKARNPEYIEIYISPKHFYDDTEYAVLKDLRREYNKRRFDSVFDNATMIFDFNGGAIVNPDLSGAFNNGVLFVPFFNRVAHPEIKVLLFIAVTSSAATTPANVVADTVAASAAIPLEEYATGDDLADATALYGRSWAPAPDDTRLGTIAAYIGTTRYREHTVIRFVNGGDFGTVTPVTNLLSYLTKLETLKKKCSYCTRSEIFIDHFSCAKCKKALYCGKMCQIGDFEHHSMTCSE